MEEILTPYNVITHRTKGSYYKDILHKDNRIKNVEMNKYISFCFKQHEGVNIDNINIILEDCPETENGLYVIVHGNDIWWETYENWKKIVKSNVL